MTTKSNIPLAGDLRKLRLLAETQLAQWQTPERLSRTRRKRLARLLRYCFSQNRFYRRKWQAAGFSNARDLDADDAFHALPVITKDDLRSAGEEELISDGFRRSTLQRTRTSGSTGKALDLAFSAAEMDHVAARQYRGMSMAGCRPWHRVAYSRVSPVPFRLDEKASGAKGFFGLFELHHLPYELDPVERVDAIARSRANFYTCYPSYVLEMVREVPNSALRDLNLTGIVLNSELSTPAQRSAISAAFGCPVGDIYGAEEFWSIAALCPAGRHHVSDDALILEILSEDGHECAAGDVGRVVLTSLVGRAMPFVRYELGDTAAVSSDRCRCGRGTRTLSSLDGRRQDQFILPSGAHISAMEIYTAIDAMPELMRLPGFQIVQEEKTRAVVHYLRGESATEAAASVAERLRSVFGGEIDVASEPVEVLRRTKTGKTPGVVGLESGLVP